MDSSGLGKASSPQALLSPSPPLPIPRLSAVHSVTGVGSLVDHEPFGIGTRYLGGKGGEWERWRMSIHTPGHSPPSSPPGSRARQVPKAAHTRSRSNVSAPESRRKSGRDPISDARGGFSDAEGRGGGDLADLGVRALGSPTSGSFLSSLDPSSRIPRAPHNGPLLQLPSCNCPRRRRRKHIPRAPRPF